MLYALRAYSSLVERPWQGVLVSTLTTSEWSFRTVLQLQHESLISDLRDIFVTMF